MNSLYAARPEYPGKGQRVIPLEEEVSLQFLSSPSEMKAEAQRIRDRYGV